MLYAYSWTFYNIGCTLANVTIADVLLFGYNILFNTLS
jgi:hypothetical protein